MIRDPEDQQTPREKDIGLRNKRRSRAVDAVALEETNMAWRKAGREPTLEHVLADPIVQLVMRRDGVEIVALKAVIVQAQAWLAANARDINRSDAVNDHILMPL